MNKKKEKIKVSSRFILWVAILTVVILTPNTYYVFYQKCVFISPYREIFSALVASVIAASVMIFTLTKDKKTSYYFSLFEMSISAYYYIDTIGWTWGLLPCVGFTIMLPLSVYKYVEALQRIEDEELAEAAPPAESYSRDEVTAIVEKIKSGAYTEAVEHVRAEQMLSIPDPLKIPDIKSNETIKEEEKEKENLIVVTADSGEINNVQPEPIGWPDNIKQKTIPQKQGTDFWYKNK